MGEVSLLQVYDYLAESPNEAIKVIWKKWEMTKIKVIYK